MGVVQNIVRTNSKIEDKRMTYMFLVYAPNNIGSIYYMLNLRKKCILLIHDVIWLKKLQRVHINKKIPRQTNIS